MSTENNATDNEQEIIAGILRVEAFNDQFRQPNPKGRYPICRPAVGTSTCDRCGQVITGPTNRGPCPAVPADKRWGETWEESPAPALYRLGHQHRSGVVSYWSEKLFTEEEAIAACETYNAVERGELRHLGTTGLQTTRPFRDLGFRWVCRLASEVEDEAK